MVESIIKMESSSGNQYGFSFHNTQRFAHP